MVNFVNDTVLEYKTGLHFGTTCTMASYKMDGDTIRVSVSPEKQQVDSAFYFKEIEDFLVKNDTSIISLETGWKYCFLKNGNGCCTDGN